MEIPALDFLFALLSKQVQPVALKENHWSRWTFSLGNILRAKRIFIFPCTLESPSYTLTLNFTILPVPEG